MKACRFVRSASDAVLAMLLVVPVVCMAVFGPVLMGGMTKTPFWLEVLVGAAWAGCLFALSRAELPARWKRVFCLPATAAVAFLMLLVLQLALAMQTYSICGWDPQVLLTEANQRLLGTPYDGSYFYQYPNNLFLLSVYRASFTVLNRLGIADYLPWVTAASVICTNLAVAFLFLTARRAYGVRAAWLSFALGAPFAALSPWIAVPYTDTFSMPFPIGCACLAAYGAHARTWRGKAAAALAFGVWLIVGAALKPTVLIVGVASAIVMLLRCAAHETTLRRAAACVAAAALGCALGGGVVSAVTEWGTGDMLDPQRKEASEFTAAHYLMMGLSQPYGGYSYDDVLFSDAFPSKSERARGDLDEAARRLEELGPDGYAAHLLRKLNFIMNDGTFFFGREGSFYMGDAVQTGSFSRWVQSFFRADGAYYQVTAVWQNAQWIAVLFLVLAGIIRGGEDRTAWSARLCFTGIIVFLLLFEARSRYLYHMTPLISLAALGGLMALSRSRLFLPDAVFTGAAAITPEYLRENGIRALVLDVDNTLTGHGSQELPQEIADWLASMRKAGIDMVIASNNFKKRVAPFADKIGLPYVAFCCKPSPTGLARARRKLGVKKEELALVGDQIFTDSVGANLYGIRMLLVQPMYRDIKWNIRLKRHLEKPFLKRYYAKGGKLHRTP